MSLAVRDSLQAKFGWDQGVCAVRKGPGRPPASCGEMFIAIWGNGKESKAFDSRDDRIKVNVTITRRCSFAPDDRQAEEVIDEATVGLEVLADEVASFIHGDLQGAGTAAATNYQIMNRANGYITNVLPAGLVNTSYGFCEPLRFLNQTDAQEKLGEWFDDPENKSVCGLVITLYFGEAKRLQSNFAQQ